MLPQRDKGRSAVTNTADVSYVIRAAPLGNVALTAPNFPPPGTVWDLKQAVGVIGTAQLEQELSEGEVTLIVALLGFLTGRMLEVNVPLIPPEIDATPPPNGRRSLDRRERPPVHTGGPWFCAASTRLQLKRMIAISPSSAP
ncbi:hypothetical protein [Ciceribacter azotifigens]|uniref:hypothetical protein n=1 Tax=Ciceribacter azotifigens TaxID=2069303 RepID=UPI003A84EA27